MGLEEEYANEVFAGPCVWCRRSRYDDGFPVTWTCAVCKKFICRFCALRDPSGREILENTLCSEQCRTVLKTEAKMLGRPAPED